MINETLVILYLPPDNRRKVCKISTYIDTEEQNPEKRIVFDIIHDAQEKLDCRLPITKTVEKIDELYTWKVSKNEEYPFRDADWILTIEFIKEGLIAYNQNN